MLIPFLLYSITVKFYRLELIIIFYNFHLLYLKILHKKNSHFLSDNLK
jgi:hypothetical protein